MEKDRQILLDLTLECTFFSAIKISFATYMQQVACIFVLFPSKPDERDCTVLLFQFLAATKSQCSLLLINCPLLLHWIFLATNSLRKY